VYLLKSAIEIIWFLIPAAVGNAAPVLAALFFPRYDTPIDLGFFWRGKRLFGAHKTFRGFIAAVIAGQLVYMIQALCFVASPLVRYYSIADYRHLPILFGAWLGFCALSGDLFKSFIKRRLDIAPGESWSPYDQIDWTIGALLGAMPFVRISFLSVIMALLLCYPLSRAAKIVGFWLRMNRHPY
jgi:CDP-2,3-bis-(O-geranylgeranyl)-sn-glycerol synthase